MQLQKQTNTGLEAYATPQEIVARLDLVKQTMALAMQPSVHYGTVPGCGDKKVLLQPGAQTLAQLFRITPHYSTETTMLDGGHALYTIKCELYSGDKKVGEGLGSCSTDESKYAFRTEVMSKELPKEWWATKDRALLGGADIDVQKRQGAWKLVRKVPTNPADSRNTCLKMAQKRAFVCAVLYTTACGDMFTQDLEDDTVVHEHEQEPSAPQQSRQTEQTPEVVVEQPKSEESPVVQFSKLLESCGISFDQFKVVASANGWNKGWQAGAISEIDSGVVESAMKRAGGLRKAIVAWKGGQQ